MRDHVMVFAPAPVLSVTIEQQADVLELHLHAGGQGIWQARMISSLGVRVVLCAAVGGEVGAVLGRALEDEELELRMVPRKSSSGWYVHDRREGSRSEIAENPGAPLIRHDIDELYGLALAEGMRAAVSVLSGPAHPSVVDDDVYRRLASDLRANGSQVVADLSGGQLAAVLGGGVSFLKVSHEEVIEAGRAADDSVDALSRAAHQLRADGAEAVLISRAEKPALALLDDDLVEVRVPQLEIVDHRGAGDSMTAGVAAVLTRGGSLEEAVRTGAAAGAVNVTRHGLGTGRAEAVRELIGRVRLTPLD
ncbi:PfkB family carbohydrate kinase [Solwaraspora sp. WMMD406]|uniref:1-phosphofructokinase family hexose kinase n=1 Tax=Solwaraspora sp. WMMD406 TaxID=3016095 RepID=UPI0024159B24|nr:PfkB family carbohydrate kinase [Solwaraspora sp. WMMD406]MDG4766741.1 PfkB family carbohydrate kinase [Solwaraspora sp. WMMD406]